MSLEVITSTDWSAVAATIVAICTSITTVIGGIIAAIQKLKADKAELEVQATQAFFDPANNEAMTPTERTPDRSWMMADETRNFILAGCSDAEKVSVINQINEAEANGYVDYKIVIGNGYYNISYGLITGGVAPTAQTNVDNLSMVLSNSENVEGTNMRKSVFAVMVAGEKDQSQVEYIKAQMQEKDAIGIYPYTISTDVWIYTITKPAEPYFTQYGTQYSAVQKHK